MAARKKRKKGKRKARKSSGGAGAKAKISQAIKLLHTAKTQC